jgi:putative hydrolase of the HAD superfamily
LPIEAVLFDATGTLIALREPVGESYARFAAAHGVTLPAWRIDDGFRRILARREPRLFPNAPAGQRPKLERAWWRDVVRDTFRAADQTVRFENFDAFFDDVFSWYAGPGAWQLRPGARDALTTLRAQGLRLGVVSDFDDRLTKVLESLEIASFFETIVLAGSLGIAKPDARIFQAALDELRVAASKAVYVGDDPERDLAGAARAGLAAFDVRTLEDLGELPDRLATLQASAPFTEPR